MKSSLEIAKEADIKPIKQIAERIGLAREDIELHGDYVAKLKMNTWKKIKKNKEGQLILVTGITPTRFGEGKTCTSIGLTQALGQLDEDAMCTLRQPSLGPAFGIKGGANGGGYSQVLPMEKINLGLTGDIFETAAAHNLLAAMVDAHVYHKNTLNLTPESITWNRVVDMCDRPLREIKIGLGGKYNGVERKSGFAIAPASEIMAVLALSDNYLDLRDRLSNMVVGTGKGGTFVRASDLNAAGVMTAILQDTIKPNLIQTMEGQGCLMHTGPFANAAHGTNSILAIRYALRLADYVVTEAGFGSDLGGEKFFDIVCRQGGLEVDATVLVASARALKMHGGSYSKVTEQNQTKKDKEAVRKGCENLIKHIENMQKFGIPVIVAINRFPFDTKEELEIIKEEARKAGVEATTVLEVFQKGGKGGIALAKAVKKACDSNSSIRYLYDAQDSIKEKIETIAREMYGAASVTYSKKVEQEIKKFEEAGFSDMQICMAKTQKSLSGDPKLKGRPEDFDLNITEIKVSAGARFIYPIVGNILTMPGLPSTPAAEEIDITEEGEITGLS